ncbi:MAG: LysM peptidoglycan-binding domain-containing protein [Anaerolineae bacterium]|nr:LysM peptidoglycan-binding domain-containing protein [Anaerolineae bacterium]
MNRLYLALIALALAGLGCNLTSGSLAAPTPTAIPLTGAAETPTLALTPTVTPLPTAQIAPTSTTTTTSGGTTTNTGNTTGGTSGGTSGGYVPPTCIRRTSWPVYTVARGDTLSRIAQRIGSSANELTTANCLANPNLLEVGQRLYVPRLPVYRGSAGALQVTNLSPTSAYSYTAQPGAALTLAWPEVNTQGVTRVEFYAEYTAPVQQQQTLGADGYLADGAALTIHVTQHNSSAILRAAAFNGDQLVQNTATPIVINVAADNVHDIGQVVITPSTPLQGNRWRVTAGTTVTLSWADASRQALYVEFWMYPDQGGASAAQLLGVDNNPGNGASIQWAAPAGTAGTLHARAVLPGSQDHTTIMGSGVTAATITPQEYGSLSVTPAEAEGGWWVLPSHASVTLTWQNPPLTDVARVVFYSRPVGDTNAPRTELGSDGYLGDGASIQWQTGAARPVGLVHAEAYLPDGTQLGYSPALEVMVADNPPQPQEIGLLSLEPGEYADGWVRLPAGEAVTIRWAEAPASATLVHFYITPTGTGTADARTVIGTDGSLGDGAEMVWQAQGAGGHLHAEATDADGRVVLRSEPVNVYAE